MSDLEVRLVALGAHLDVPESADMVASVREQLETATITSIDRGRGRRLTPPRPAPARIARLLAAAALVAVLGVVAMPSARHAIANFFRVDGVRLRSVRDLPPSTRPVGTNTTAGPPAVSSLAVAQSQVAFPIRVPASPAPSAVTVDRSIPGGGVTLEFLAYRVFEAPTRSDRPIMEKFLGSNSHITQTVVRGQPGYWITGTHHVVAYVDDAGKIRNDTVHTEGHVLVWNEGGLLIRVDGPTTLGRAQAIAASLLPA